jgi:hypothetical protein
MSGHPIAALIGEIGNYVGSLAGPGIAEVSRGIARWGEGLARPMPAREIGACNHLPAALAAIEGHESLRAAIWAARPHLAWEAYAPYPAEKIGRHFPGAHAFASLMGGEAPVFADDFEFGLFLIAPGILYRDHRHAAPELYAPLTGPHRWRFGGDDGWASVPAHVPVWNEPWRVHATITGAVPFLSIFCWTRDVNDPAEVVMADDWDMVEAGL